MDVSVFFVTENKKCNIITDNYKMFYKQFFKLGLDIKEFSILEDLLGVDYKSFSKGLTIFVEDEEKRASSLLVPLNQMQDLGNGIFIDSGNDLIIINMNLLEELDNFQKFLIEHLKINYNYHCIKCFGILESNLTDYLKEFKLSNNVFDYLIQVDNGDCLVVFRFLSTINRNIQENLVSSFVKDLKSSFYASKDVSLVQAVNEILSIQNAKISIAETFTAGAITNELTKFNDKFIEDSFVLLSKNSFALLKVDSKLLEKTCISPEIAYELVVNMLNFSRCDIAVLALGEIYEEKNIYTCTYFTSIGDNEAVNVYKHKVSGSKDFIKEYSKNTLIFELIKKLRQNALNISNYAV